ncbi:MAG TPA: 1,2-phenylacetyl-CoA epoxidase subunit PaaC [Actinomycetes bacterium]|nr:1,2-phenylacetyl-CoA epoxidase subunit PaaC [Actinomycetes bacterium]
MSAQALDGPVRGALTGLLLAMADDEFVLGFWDSEWTGIAPILEEDVAFASLAQDEIGHAQALYGLVAELEGGDPDELAFGRPPEAYRQARLLDHPRTDWAFSVARRFLYDTADAARLDALVASAYAPLAGVVAKMRREETYHLLHMHAWLERLANGGPEPHARLVAALERLWPDALCVLAGVEGDDLLVEAGVLAEPMAAVRRRWLAGLAPELARLGLPTPPDARSGPCRGPDHGDDFRWLWEQFTMVRRSDPEAVW